MNKEVKHFYDLAYDYYIAAVSLWGQIASKNHIYNPTIYILRHAIELLLKGLIISENLKMCRNVDISKICICDNNSKPNINSTHSLLCLWDNFKQLNKDNCLLSYFNVEQESFIETQLKTFDEKDARSTTFRYPYTKQGKSIIIKPVQVNETDFAPEISKNPPKIIIVDSKIYTVTRGFKYINQAQKLFDVAKLLFDFYE